MIEQEVIAAEWNAALRAAFGELAPRCRELLSMLITDPPPSYAKISATLQIPVGNIGLAPSPPTSPPGLTKAKPPASARAQGGQPVLRPGPMITAATVLYAGVPWLASMTVWRGVVRA